MSQPDGPSAAVNAPPESLTAERVTELLREAGHDVTVASLTATPVGTGQMGASYRLALTFDGDPGEVPSTLVGKTAFGPPERRMISAGSYRTEVEFYRHIAPKVRGRVPRCWATWANDDCTDFVLLLEDLAPRQQGDQILGCSVEEARQAAVNLAGMHAPLWNDPWLTEHLTPFDDQQGLDLDAVFPMMIDLFLSRFGERLSADSHDVYGRIKDVTGRWFTARPAPFAAVHGDYRLDNLMFAPDGSDVAVVDWQTVSLGLPARDLAFLCGTGLSVEDRRANDDALVEAYHSGLVDLGVEGYDLSACRDDYAFGMLQAPLVIVFGSAVAEITDRGNDMFTAMTERSTAAILDLGTLDRIP